LPTFGRPTTTTFGITSATGFSSKPPVVTRRPETAGVAPPNPPNARLAERVPARGYPVPSRRTFASALQAPALSDLPALRHPACAGQIRRLNGRGNPGASSTQEARGVSRREYARRFPTGASSRLAPRASRGTRPLQNHSSVPSSSTRRPNWVRAVATGSGFSRSTPASRRRSSGHFEQPPFRNRR